MPYKVGRVSNNQSKKSGSREVVVQSVVESVEENVVAENVVAESVVEENVVAENVAEMEENPVVKEEVVEEVVPLQSEIPNVPLFNEDYSKVLNPITNRYVKVGGDIDKKLNLSQRY